ncbi:LptF/LptG family permease [Gluconacetobacter diazotrophicus]|uniref:Putative permease n=1 Tax=Gluconacetobacter diazotrophicus (strain ATCC 49037 / DSM 5601 / CCUG 37298 / CIP 103539 / LMG 7603 / PAl5) TaxID=272568 RepID=A9HRC7_GLUDA|nr:LptF/LptG family permease [Gluconacetobacter diazotrophicus]CAP56875.1 putative permease [Gluconacetobacter diazotrophicus PA1 5]
MTRAPLTLPVIRRIVPGTLDRYLIGQMLPPFLLSLGVVMTALLLERLLTLLNVLASDGGTLKIFAGLLADLVPHYLGLALPAAICVSVFSVVRRMSQNNEIDALMASGVSLLRIARPFVVMGAVLGLVGFSLYGFIQPYARYDFRQALYIASHAGWTPHLQARMFAAPSDTLMLTADQVQGAGTRLRRVFIRDKSAGLERDITADSGRLLMTDDGTTVRLDLAHGVIVTDRNDDRPTLTTFDTTTRFFQTSSKAHAFRNRGNDERELTVLELRHGIRHRDLAIRRTHLVAELHFRLARAMAIPFIPILACALAGMAKRQRHNTGLAIAAISLVGFDHALQLGLSLVASRSMSPWLVIWGPFAVFGFACVWLILRRAGSAGKRQSRLRLLGRLPHRMAAGLPR